jgi:hypothetical protein
MLSLAERPAVAGAVPLMAAPLDVAEGIVDTENWYQKSVVIAGEISGRNRREEGGRKCFRCPIVNIGKMAGGLRIEDWGLRFAKETFVLLTEPETE